MSTQTHTPAPWKAYGTWVSAGVDGDGPLIADCDTDVNADLIAVAPELLQQLELLVEHLVINEVCDDRCADLFMARAAIAKARGE